MCKHYSILKELVKTSTVKAGLMIMNKVDVLQYVLSRFSLNYERNNKLISSRTIAVACNQALKSRARHEHPWSWSDLVRFGSGLFVKFIHHFLSRCFARP